jgi:hypothetical protein
MDGRRPSTNKKKGLEASTKWRTSARVTFGNSETQLFGDAEAPPTTVSSRRKTEVELVFWNDNQLDSNQEHDYLENNQHTSQ